MVKDLISLSSWGHSNLPPYDALLLDAAFALAFFGLLRVSEFTCPSPVLFDKHCQLGLEDIHVDSLAGSLWVFIKVSKTDPFRQGVTIRIYRTGSRVCPFSAMVAFLHYRRQFGAGPLFILSNGQFLTRKHIVLVLTQVFPNVPSGSVGSHSFRIGGATRLCSLGVPEGTIQILGRWSSSAFKKYLHLTDQYVATLQGRMSGGDPDPGCT